MSTPTNETLQLAELLKKEAGLQWQDEAIGLGIIQKQFEEYRNKKTKKKFYFLRVGFYHNDDVKVGFRVYPGKAEGSYQNLEWSYKNKGTELQRLNISYSVLKISEEEIKRKEIDLSRCHILFVEYL